MKIRTTLRSWGRTLLKSLGAAMTSFGSWALSAGAAIASRRVIYDKAFWLRAYDESLIVQIPVRRISEDFAKVVFQLKRIVYQREGPPIFRQLFKHPFLRLLRRPSKNQTWAGFATLMIRHWLTCGEVIIYIEERNFLGEPTSIFLVEPHKLNQTPIDNAEGLYKFTVGEGIHRRIVDAPMEDVVYINNPSAFACHGRGVGQVTALSREVQLDEKSSDWSLSIYDNGAHAGAIVHIPDLEDDDLEKLQAHWDREHTGMKNVGKTLFVSAESLDGKAPMSVERIGTGHKELDYTESKKDLLLRALILFGVPYQVVGHITGGSRSDTSGADYVYQSKTVEPLLIRFAQEFELKLLPQFRGTTNLVVTFESPVREDAAFRHKRLIEGIKMGAATKDEWRAEAALDPMVGKLGNSLALPLNMTHCDTDGNTIIEADKEAPEVREEDDADNAASSVALRTASRGLEEALAELKGMKTLVYRNN